MTSETTTQEKMPYQTTAQVADRLRTSRKTLNMIVMRHPDLKPRIRVGSNASADFLWTESEIEALVAHKAGHRRGRPKQK